MSKFVKSPIFAFSILDNTLSIVGMFKSYKITTSHSIATLTSVIGEIAQPFLPAALINKFRGDDYYTVSNFIKFLIDKKIIIPYENAVEFKKVHEDLSAFKSLGLLESSDGVQNCRSTNKVSIFCAKEFSEAFKWCQQMYASFDIDIIEIDNSLSSEEIDNILSNNDLDLLVVALPQKDSPILHKLNARCHLAGKTWISAYISRAIATYGPIVVPDVTPCWSCAQNRVNLQCWQTSSNDSEDMVLPQITYPKSMIYTFCMLLMQHIAMYCLVGINAPLVGSIQKINLIDYRSIVSRVFYFPECDVCGGN